LVCYETQTQGAWRNSSKHWSERNGQRLQKLHAAARSGE